MVIGKTQFNVETIKSLSVSAFVKLYKNQFNDETENLYYKITGFKKEKKKSKED